MWTAIVFQAVMTQSIPTLWPITFHRVLHLSCKTQHNYRMRLNVCYVSILMGFMGGGTYPEHTMYLCVWYVLFA